MDFLKFGIKVWYGANSYPQDFTYKTNKERNEVFEKIKKKKTIYLHMQESTVKVTRVARFNVLETVKL